MIEWRALFLVCAPEPDSAVKAPKLHHPPTLLLLLLHSKYPNFLSTTATSLSPLTRTPKVLCGLWIMGSTGTDKMPGNKSTGSSEATIEIKIKTLDSQTYTLRVDKQMPVPALKEQIASVTGVLSDRQRLICQGKVLKDDQLLSAYHVEDGHTLHLVSRQPDLSGSLPNHSGADPNSSTSHGHSSQISPGVFIETFNVPVQGDGVTPEFSRIVSAVLGSIGIPSFGSGVEGIDVREHDSQGFGRTSGTSGLSDSSHPHPEQAGLRSSSDRLRNPFVHPAAASLGSLQPPVIPDSLTTLSQFLSHISHEFDAIVREGGNNVPAADAHRNEDVGSASSRLGSTPEALSSPASLAEIMLSSRRMMIEQAGECLLQLARQLENQANVTDPLVRSSVQSRALRAGVLFYNLGALFLELGRTTMTLRLGQSPSEAVVNGGPAVFVSPSGPNHIMVQPLPFQPGANFGTVPIGHAQSNASLGSGLGSSFFPRRIDIQIRRGVSTATPNASQEERADTQSASVQRNQGEGPANQANSRRPDVAGAGEQGVRILPIRTMVATVPGSLGRPPSEPSGNSIGVYYPVLGRFQQVSSGHGNSEQGSQPPSQHHAVQQSSREDTLRRQRSSSTPTTSSNSRVVNINILSAGGAQNNQESERQIPNSVLQFIRTLFPGGEIHVEDLNLEGTNSGSTSEQAATARAAQAPEAEPRVSDEGIFLSNILREIIPIVSQQTDSGRNPSEEQAAQGSSSQVETDAGTSRRRNGSDPSPPDSKRQKME
ncbi:Ubiquitin-like domain-containing protein cip73 [Stylosanthes scabra]|uniref:Ubiquitin-like domain-containing protein cip73 n=1 Tax=Stylosanthes scabra TaxID=79078 RepID=A0ABU6ZKM8_9FABA|nr:Ubiquitin-like domain-containing protein cip73 [Stylosanthes scabra]